MSAFMSSKEIERRGNEVLMPYLEEKADGRVVVTNKGTLAKWLQESLGDVILQRDEQVFAVELKCEREHTGNVFLEIWSNRNLESRASHAERGQTPGWMMKSRADLLLCYYLDKDILYSFDLLHLKRWLFGHGTKPGEQRTGVLHSVQGTPKLTHSSQLNDTWGVCAPVDRLRSELPFGAMKETTVRQRELLEAA